LAEQPWRNPRPAPELDEIRRRVPAFQMIPAWLRAWWPALVWACIIFTLSTDSFSAENTSRIVSPILHWFFPHASAETLDTYHQYVRKAAHFSEYFVFYLFLFRGVRSNRKGWRWTWGLAALSIAAGYSALDEIHQAFVVSRTASPWDSLLDSVGAFVASIVVFLWYFFHRRRTSSPQ